MAVAVKDIPRLDPVASHCAELMAQLRDWAQGRASDADAALIARVQICAQQLPDGHWSATLEDLWRKICGQSRCSPKTMRLQSRSPNKSASAQALDIVQRKSLEGLAPTQRSEPFGIKGPGKPMSGAGG